MVLAKLPYFRISGAIPSGLAFLSSIRLSFTLLYSSFVKGPVCIARVLSLIVLIRMVLVSCSYSIPIGIPHLYRSFLKLLYNLLTWSFLLLALIFPLFGFLRPVTLLINFQLAFCVFYVGVYNFSFNSVVYDIQMIHKKNYLKLNNFYKKNIFSSFVLRTEYSLYAVIRITR